MTKKELQTAVAAGLDAFGEEGVLEAILKAQKEWYGSLNAKTKIVDMHCRTKMIIIDGALRLLKELWKNRKELDF